MMRVMKTGAVAHLNEGTVAMHAYNKFQSKQSAMSTYTPGGVDCIPHKMAACAPTAGPKEGTHHDSLL
jgi:hypothetical protein